MKHTKGPWTIYRNPHATKNRLEDSPDYEKHIYDSIDPIGILIDTPVIEKNAALIAAAPEMLEALEAIVNRDIDDPNSYDKAFEKVLKAIKKAKGVE
jgi:hypothetical protein